MRALADQYAHEGLLTRARANALKCDPRLAFQNMPVKVRVELTPLGNAVLAQRSGGTLLAAGCGTTGRIWAEIGWPTTLEFFQSLQWCWDGSTVSDWGGECSGNVTRWGWANFWHFDGCTTNDFIKYWLGGRFPGGIHHRTIGHFTNDVPWVPHYDQLISTWGHFDGTADYRVY
jgi:hypothetical protein